MRKLILLFALAGCCFMASAQTSPNGKVKAAYVEGKGLVVSYRNAGQWIELASVSSDCNVLKKKTKGKVSYETLSGKKSRCTNAYVEGEYAKNGNSSDILRVRVYNDGVTFPVRSGVTASFATSTNNWLQEWTEPYEQFFPKNPTVKADGRYAFPALFEYAGGVFALVTESNMTAAKAASSMYPSGKPLTFNLRPDGNDGGDVTLIVGKLADIVASTLVTDNSAPCCLDDVSWIQPGVAAWIYWAYNHGSNDFSIIKKYVDMAAVLKLPYVLIDAEWDEMKDGYTIEDAVKYAADNGVKPIIWYNSSIGWINGAPGPKFRLNKPEDREKEFAWCERIGVKGVKIDFFSGDNNRNISYMYDLMQCAAKHHLLVNFHGATIPRGWQRTYPNLISTEGVYGAEWYNNLPVLTKKAAAHNATLPFTRNVVGPMDYTPCAFTDSQHPHITTNAHELALTALFESGIQHLADRPESFLSQPQEVKDYLSRLPASWDETRLLGGYPGDNVVIARRKGTTWYVAGINGTDEQKTINFGDIRQLKLKNKKMTMFADGTSKEEPWLITTKQVSKSDIPHAVSTLPRGGFLIVFE